jgi:very-short-patch-repair endonuclease
MRARQDPPDLLRDLAAAQCGVLGAVQLTDLGFSLRSAERLVTQRHWRRLATGIYSVGPGDPPWRALAWAGLLLGGTRSRLGYEAAGHLWGIVDDEPRSITVLVPMGRDIVDRERWVFRREAQGVRDPRSPGAPSRTTIEDTVVDLCRRVHEREVLDIVTKAVQTRRTSARRILRCVDGRVRVSHRRHLHHLLDDVVEGAQSALELRYLNHVERAHGLPQATRQARARRGRAFRDVRYDEYATLVELDGQGHARQVLRDARRDNSALLDGEVTLRYGWADVTERACQVAWEVAAILSVRGWTGLPVRCGRCESASAADLRFT